MYDDNTAKSTNKDTRKFEKCQKYGLFMQDSAKTSPVLAVTSTKAQSAVKNAQKPSLGFSKRTNELTCMFQCHS